MAGAEQRHLARTGLLYHVKGPPLSPAEGPLRPTWARDGQITRPIQSRLLEAVQCSMLLYSSLISGWVHESSL
jgi:hypothetical protein